MTKKPIRFVFYDKCKLSAILDFPCVFLGWIVWLLRLLRPFFVWNLKALSRYAFNELLERLWNDPGDEEDISDYEFDDESDEDYWDESQNSEHDV